METGDGSPLNKAVEHAAGNPETCCLLPGEDPVLTGCEGAEYRPICFMNHPVKICDLSMYDNTSIRLAVAGGGAGGACFGIGSVLHG